MKIAMLSSFYSPHRGGTEKYVEDLSENLVKRGHEVTVFTHTRGRQAVENGVRIVRVPALWLSYLPVPLRTLSDELNEFDVINYHIPPSVFPLAIPEGLRVPHVITYHCDPLLPDFYKGRRIPKPVRRIADSYMRKQAETVLNKADSIIVTSDDYASTSGIVGKFDYTAVPIGVNAAEFSRGTKGFENAAGSEAPKAAADNNRPVILYLGRLASGKGVDVLLKAAALLKTEGLNFGVELIGGGEEYNNLRRLSSSLELDDTVIFRGSLPRPELVNGLNKASALVLPSRSRLEAFGIVQLEAFCARTPVIASAIPGVRQIIADTGGGWLFPPGDCNALADRIRYVIQNPEAAKAAGDRGYNSINSMYNWDVISGRIEQVYLGCIKERNSA